ncbi:hypothetical protein EJ06DRAFT_107450 [Trichodelitschia bisporula]|uniref:Uncharacterized protein n=1 Tax=Trichodelitschia bisporula TaxID=703511 RepID=A0A6G1HRC0_9PEZI|nr:hypothetical protein EJ06DRAFT_107450 [Trichodelitschia bisporula]
MACTPDSFRALTCTCRACSPHMYGDPAIDPHHVNPNNPRTHFRTRRKLERSQFQRCEPLALAHAASASFERDVSNFSARQKAALEKLNNMPPLLNPITRPVAAEIIKHFNEIFFLGAIRNLKFKLQPDLARKSSAVGYAHFPRRDASRIMYPELVFDPDTRASPDNDITATILHECVHVFLSQFSCDTSDGFYIWYKAPQDFQLPNCGSSECPILVADNSGLTGHGRAFASLATAIERSARRVLGRPIDLCAWMGAEDEILMDAWRPSPCDLNNFFPSRAELLNDLMTSTLSARAIVSAFADLLAPPATSESEPIPALTTVMAP